MDSMERNPIRVGLLAGEPIRLEGLATVFEQEPLPGRARLLPVVGSLGVRPQLRLIVIGPEGNDELLLDSITAGARAYLAGTAGPDMVRQAIEVVVSGSIWAPRRLLSQLIDRMLESSRNNGAGSPQSLTAREREVLDLILQARSNREIARELGIEERTVKAHVSRLMRKTGSENRVDLSMWAVNGSLAHSHRSAARARLKP